MADGATRLRVKVSPGSARTRVGPWMADGTLKVAVTAPPEAGRANAAVCDLLARALGLPASAVRLVSSPSNPRKVFAIDGLDADAVRQRLSVAEGKA